MLCSGLPRTLETASIVAPGAEPESWPELREIQGGRLSEIPADALQREFVHAFRGVIPNETRFLRGESIGELFDRVLPAVERLVADDGWDTALAVLHGGVNRAILSYALTGERMFLGHFEQAPACVNVLDLGEGGEWIVRAVNVAPYDLLHLAHRPTTMERYWEQYRAPDAVGAGDPGPYHQSHAGRSLASAGDPRSSLPNGTQIAVVELNRWSCIWLMMKWSVLRRLLHDAREQELVRVVHAQERVHQPGAGEILPGLVQRLDERLRLRDPVADLGVVRRSRRRRTWR